MADTLKVQLSTGQAVAPKLTTLETLLPPDGTQTHSYLVVSPGKEVGSYVHFEPQSPLVAAHAGRTMLANSDPYNVATTRSFTREQLEFLRSKGVLVKVVAESVDDQSKELGIADEAPDARRYVADLAGREQFRGKTAAEIRAMMRERRYE